MIFFVTRPFSWDCRVTRCWPDTFFYQVFVGQSCELQGFRITRCRHQCCIYARSNRRGNLCESAFRYQILCNGLSTAHRFHIEGDEQTCTKMLGSVHDRQLSVIMVSVFPDMKERKMKMHICTCLFFCGLCSRMKNIRKICSAKSFFLQVIISAGMVQCDLRKSCLET